MQAGLDRTPLAAGRYCPERDHGRSPGGADAALTHCAISVLEFAFCRNSALI